MTDDTPTPGSNGPPPPTFPWEHGTVAPSTPVAGQPENPYAYLPSLEVPAQAYHPTPDPFEGILATDAAPSHADLPPDDDTPLVAHLPTEPKPEVDAAAPAAPFPTRSRAAARRAASGNRAPGPRWLMYLLGAISVALVITIVVLLIIVLQPKGTAPVDSPQPSSPAGETPAPPAEGEGTIGVGPTFDSFESPASSGCEEGDVEKPIEFSWASADAVRAYIGVATEDARAEAFDGDLPPTHTYTFIVYLCDQESQFYTVSIEDTDGELTHKTVTVTR